MEVHCIMRNNTIYKGHTSINLINFRSHSTKQPTEFLQDYFVPFLLHPPPHFAIIDLLSVAIDYFE